MYHVGLALTDEQVWQLKQLALARRLAVKDLVTALVVREIDGHKKESKTKKEETKILNLVRSGNVYTWDYKWEGSEKGKPKHIGVIAEEAPREMVTPDRMAQDLGNTVNILLTSVRALDRKIGVLTRKRARTLKLTTR